MNALLLTLGLLTQCEGVSPACSCPSAATIGCQSVCSPCYDSPCFGCRTVCGNHCVGALGLCAKPIGDLHQHYPYTSQPQMYYYLRPYNHQHVRDKAAHAEALGAHPKAPYSNALFQEVYQSVESQFGK